MKWVILFGGGLIVFLYALSNSAAQADTGGPDIQPPAPGPGGIVPTAINRQALVTALGLGIANGEGYFQEGTKPNRLNNPGDLKLGGNSISTFAYDTYDNPQPGGGWDALYHQLNLNLNGTSRAYSLDMTLGQMVAKWIDFRPGGESTQAQYDGYLPHVLNALNDAGFPVTADITLGALARGDYSGGGGW